MNPSYTRQSQGEWEAAQQRREVSTVQENK